MGLSLKSIGKWISNPGNWVDPLGVFGIGQGVGKNGDVVGDVVDTISGKNAAEDAMKYQEQQITKQNEYNTPANQVKRLLDAGLNPNLFYSMGNTGNQQNVPEYHSYDKMKFLSLMTGFANLQNVLQQNANLKAQRSATEVNTAYRGLINGSIQRWGMPPNMLTGLFSAFESAGYSPEQAIKTTLDLFSKVGGFFGGALGTGLGTVETMFPVGVRDKETGNYIL